MKKMKKSLAMAMAAVLCLGSVLAMTGCEKKEVNRLEEIMKNGKITMVTEPYFAPSEFIDSSKSGQDQYQGLDIEMAKYIAESLGVELEIVPVEFSSVVTGVTEGKYDIGMAGFAYTAERAEVAAMSDVYWSEGESKGHGLLVKKDRVGEFKSLDDFKGLTVAAQNGSIQQGFVNDQIDDVKLQVVTAVNDGFLMVQEGKIDACATSWSTGELYSGANPDVVMSEVKFVSPPDGNVAIVQKGQDDLLNKINEIIQDAWDKGLQKQWHADAMAYAESLGIEVN